MAEAGAQPFRLNALTKKPAPFPAPIFCVMAASVS
jgi:hypothetical protein